MDATNAATWQGMGLGTLEVRTFVSNVTTCHRQRSCPVLRRSCWSLVNLGYHRPGIVCPLSL